MATNFQGLFFKIDVQTRKRGVEEVEENNTGNGGRTSDNRLVPEMFGYDFKLVYQFGTWYFSAPVYKDSPPQRIPGRESVVAIDPGVRKFATTYSPEGTVEILGGNTQKVMLRHLRRKHRRAQHMKDGYKAFELAKKAVNQQPHRRKVKKRLRRQNRRCRQAYHKSERKIQNVVKNFHYRVAHRLCRQYQTIILPNFSSHACSRRDDRKIGKQTVSIMQALSFYQFKGRLKETMSQYENTKLITGSEAYTSKQCGGCGYLNDKLGGSEHFHCRRCAAKADRDIHAARNILLRFLKCQECHRLERTTCSGCRIPVHVSLPPPQ
jgi:putative transposase